jgi:hypothetical protein
MPIHMGIMCEACRKVYFTGTSGRIYVSRKVKTMYHLICILPCLERKEFRVDTMRSYRVDEDVFKSGFARETISKRDNSVFHVIPNDRNSRTFIAYRKPPCSCTCFLERRFHLK